MYANRGVYENAENKEKNSILNTPSVLATVKWAFELLQVLAI